MTEEQLLKAFEEWRGSKLEDKDVVGNFAFEAFKQGYKTAIKVFL